MAKAIIVTIKKGKHKTQPFSFTIDKPGPASNETRKERYANPSNARRAARNILEAFWKDDQLVAVVGGRYLRVEFVNAWK